MTRDQLNKQLVLLQKDALKVEKRMSSIAKKLDIPDNEDIKKIVNEIQLLLQHID